MRRVYEMNRMAHGDADSADRHDNCKDPSNDIVRQVNCNQHQSTVGGEWLREHSNADYGNQGGLMDLLQENGLALRGETGLKVLKDIAAGGGFGVTLVEAAGVDASQSSYSVGSHTLTAGRLYLLSVHTRGSLPSSIVLSGVTFALIDSGEQGNGTTALYRCVPGSNATGAIAINFSSNPSRCSWNLVEVTGTAAVSGDNGAAAVLQSANNYSDGTSTFTVTLPSGLGSAANLVVAACTHGNNDEATPEEGWTQLSHLTTGDSWDRVNATFNYKVGTSDNSYSENWGYNSGSGVIAEIEV